jgi:hypothetical protein
MAARCFPPPWSIDDLGAAFTKIYGECAECTALAAARLKVMGMEITVTVPEPRHRALALHQITR